MHKIRVSVVGALGYTGYELVKIFLRHPLVELKHLADKAGVGSPYSELFPVLKGLCDLHCTATDVALIARDSDVIFFGLPHLTSMEVIPEFLKYHKKIIDLSADYRLNTAELFLKAYGAKHRDEGNLSSFVYGLPEFNREKIRQANNVANPGCFPTGIILALMPALASGLIKPDAIIVDSKTGISGGGKTPKPVFHFPECNENFMAYKIAAHQHEPEIEQELSKVAGQPVDIVLVPHLMPLTRGIFNTIYAELTSPLEPGDLHNLYCKQYEREPFVRILDYGKSPEIKHVAYTNFCDIGMKIVG
ncbi:N-acetyl-gamma-glutamyl-phosphate reductase, partial [candidate division KSB1 bacterium]